MPIPNYKKELKPVLPAHFFKPHPETILWMGFNLVIVATMFYLLKTRFDYAWAWLASILIANCFASMGFSAHEIAHGSAVKGKRLRPILAAIGFSPLWIGPTLWTKWHNSEHHNHTQVAGEDPDHLFTMEHYESSSALRMLYRMSPLLRNLVIFGSFGFRMTQQSMRMWTIHYNRAPKGSPDRRRLMIELLLPALFWIGVSAALGWQVFVFGYVLPFIIENYIVISYIATNHFLNPLADENDCLETSLSVTLPKGFGWLDAWHQNFGAHVAHHLYPGVPSRYAREIDAACKKHWPDRFHEMPLHKALKALWDTPWVYDGRTELVDPQSGARSGTLGYGMGVQRPVDSQALVEVEDVDSPEPDGDETSDRVAV